VINIAQVAIITSNAINANSGSSGIQWQIRVMICVRIINIGMELCVWIA